MTDASEPVLVEPAARLPGHLPGSPDGGAVPIAPGPSSGHGARVVVTKLGKSYLHGGKGLPILWDIDLVLESGSMVAVVGASGVGKSTFLQLLGTLDLPTTGSIQFDGEELTTMSPSRLAEFRNRRIGFVFQFHHLLPEFTALENVMMPALIQRTTMERARSQARDILGRVGLLHRLTHRPSELSGGEQQRVAIARALVNDPFVLIADEPTGNLDDRATRGIFQLLRDINAAGTAVMMATHNLDLIRRQEYRTVEMNRGAVVFDSGEAASPSSTPES